MCVCVCVYVLKRSKLTCKGSDAMHPEIPAFPGEEN